MLLAFFKLEILAKRLPQTFDRIGLLATSLGICRAYGLSPGKVQS